MERTDMEKKAVAVDDGTITTSTTSDYVLLLHTS